MSSFCGATVISVLAWASCWFANLVFSKRCNCFSIAASSIFSKRSSAVPMRCPAFSNSVAFVFRFSQVIAPNCNIRFSFSEVKGKKGSLATAKAVAICKATYITVFTRSGSVLMSFQGSSSAKYLLPKRAIFISSC